MRVLFNRELTVMNALIVCPSCSISFIHTTACLRTYKKVSSCTDDSLLQGSANEIILDLSSCDQNTITARVCLFVCLFFYFFYCVAQKSLNLMHLLASYIMILWKVGRLINVLGLKVPYKSLAWCNFHWSTLPSVEWELHVYEACLSMTRRNAFCYTCIYRYDIPGYRRTYTCRLQCNTCRPLPESSFMYWSLDV